MRNGTLAPKRDGGQASLILPTKCFPAHLYRVSQKGNVIEVIIVSADPRGPCDGLPRTEATPEGMAADALGVRSPYRAEDVFSATAARISAFSALSSIASPS